MCSRPYKFIDLFSGLGGFHLALKRLGHKCVFSSEINESLCDLYEKNFSLRPEGDIRQVEAWEIPKHDVLCAGFPCQPFSKAGEQLGTDCKLWGDLFSDHVLRVIKYHLPTFLLMENVANLERHDGGRTWQGMRSKLEDCGYDVDTRVLSPHDYGVPQIRKRLFIVASLKGLQDFDWPQKKNADLSVDSVLDYYPKEARSLPDQVVRCLDVWQEFMDRSPKKEALPWFPIWTMEFGATYPYTKYDSLHDLPLRSLRNYKGSFGQTLNRRFRREIIPRLPSYARAEEECFPDWKQSFIRLNREYYERNKRWIKPWLPKIREFPASLQKFEWNCKGEERDIRSFVIQVRASGVRVKRPTTAPSLVAMTGTQIPIIGWENRYMTARECSRLQSMGSIRHLPKTTAGFIAALGNAVNVEVVKRIALTLCGKVKPVRKKAKAA